MKYWTAHTATIATKKVNEINLRRKTAIWTLLISTSPCYADKMRQITKLNEMCVARIDTSTKRTRNKISRNPTACAMRSIQRWFICSAQHIHHLPGIQIQWSRRRLMVENTQKPTESTKGGPLLPCIWMRQFCCDRQFNCAIPLYSRATKGVQQHIFPRRFNSPYLYETKCISFESLQDRERNIQNETKATGVVSIKFVQNAAFYANEDTVEYTLHTRLVASPHVWLGLMQDMTTV